MASPEWADIPFVGLTATPWSRGLGKIYDRLLKPITMQELIELGHLSKFRIFAPEAPDLAAVRTTNGDFHEGELSLACDKKELVADIVKTWIEKGENRPTHATAFFSHETLMKSMVVKAKSNWCPISRSQRVVINRLHFAPFLGGWLRDGT